MSSVAFAQTPLLTVHLKETLLPAVTPVTVVAGEDAVVMVAFPLTMDHTPVPIAGAVAAMVNVDVLHKV